MVAGYLDFVFHDSEEVLNKPLLLVLNLALNVDSKLFLAHFSRFNHDVYLFDEVLLLISDELHPVY